MDILVITRERADYRHEVAVGCEEAEREIFLHRYTSAMCGALVECHGVGCIGIVWLGRSEDHAVIEVFPCERAGNGRFDAESFLGGGNVHIPVELKGDGSVAEIAVISLLPYRRVRLDGRCRGPYFAE